MRAKGRERGNPVTAPVLHPFVFINLKIGILGAGFANYFFHFIKLFNFLEEKDGYKART